MDWINEPDMPEPKDVCGVYLCTTLNGGDDHGCVVRICLGEKFDHCAVDLTQ